jgi:two-component system response regulator AdeR
MGCMACQRKILICDDDPLAVRALARQARAAGWIALAETVASRVLPLALKHRPDLIVLDVHQLIDGRELLVALRADTRTSGVRMVMVSGSDLPKLSDECLKLGADAFVPKPFDFPALFGSSSPELAMTEPAPKCTLLIADDNPLMVAALVRGAQREGFATVTDTTSTHVMELARIHRPEVIVLDVHQAIDGRQILAELKRDPHTRDIKVVMLSGEEDQVTRHDCFKLGAEDYFTKPLDPLFFRRISRIAGVEVR